MRYLYIYSKGQSNCLELEQLLLLDSSFTSFSQLLSYSYLRRVIEHSEFFEAVFSCKYILSLFVIIVLLKLPPSWYQETVEAYLEPCETSLLERFCKALLRLNTFSFFHKDHQRSLQGPKYASVLNFINIASVILSIVIFSLFFVIEVQRRNAKRHRCRNMNFSNWL